MKTNGLSSSRFWKRLALGVVLILALTLAFVSVKFGISAAKTKSATLFGRQTSLAGIWSFVLAALTAAAGMIFWVWRLNRQMSRSLSAARRWRLISVRDCQPTDVRVHASSDPEAGPPLYVDRDHDRLLRGRLEAAQSDGGFVLVIGGSSTGKSRSLLNAVQTSLPDWHILLPKDSAAVREAVDSGKMPSRTVIWLDDTPVEKYITANEGGLSGHDLQRLLDGKKSIIVIDSMWPSRYEALMARPGDSANGRPLDDPSRDARDVLSLARETIRVGEQFSNAERERARSLAYRDARLEAALKDAQFGVTQALAGAPALVRRYRDAESADPNAYALMTAAIDARRIGSSGTLTGASF